LEWNVKKFYEKLEEIKAAMDNYNEGRMLNNSNNKMYEPR